MNHAWIRVIGTGEAFGSALGNTSYLLSGASGSGIPTVLMDCGYQIPERLWANGLEEGIEAVCLTHLHADHAFGLVPLLARYWEDGRKRELTIFGPPGTERWLRRLFELGYPGMMEKFAYPISFETLREGKNLHYRGLKIRCARTRHSVLNHTIRIDAADGSFGAFAVSGDGVPTPGTKKLLQGVSVLFQEAYHERTKSPVHADLGTLEKWLARARVGEIRIAHLSRREIRKIESASPWNTVRPGERIRL